MSDAWKAYTEWLEGQIAQRRLDIAPLANGSMRINHNRQDVTARELARLQGQLRELEALLADAQKGAA